MANTNYQYAKIDNKYIIKLSGELKYKWSSGFNNFLQKIFQKDDFDEIVVDLSETSYIDSTNIGLLAKIARFSLRKFSRKLPVIVDQKDEDVKELLIGMGFNKLCNFIKIPENFDHQYKTIKDSRKSKEDLGKMILDAHKTLSKISQKNKKQFKNVVELLEQQTRKDEEDLDKKE